MINGITYIKPVLDGDRMFTKLMDQITWDTRMKARKTASFGKSYDYSQMSYPEVEALYDIDLMMKSAGVLFKFNPNNCLINLYEDGKQTMGWHSDEVDKLVEGTGVAILSLGSVRTLAFRRIDNKDVKVNYELENGSFFYMTDDVQKEWQHSILKSDTDKPRMSLTFRELI